MQTKQEYDLQKKFEDHENLSHKSVIMEKDDNTLIVSQHIPEADDLNKQ